MNDDDVLFWCIKNEVRMVGTYLVLYVSRRTACLYFATRGMIILFPSFFTPNFIISKMRYRRPRICRVGKRTSPPTTSSPTDYHLLRYIEDEERKRD